MIEFHKLKSGYESKINPQILNTLESLERKINSLIQDGIFFFRINRRTAKDYISSSKNAKTYQVFSSYLSQEAKKMSFLNLKSQKSKIILFCWQKTISHLLAVTNGFDIIELIASSIKITGSITSSTDSVLYIQPFLLIDPALEFRIITYNKKMTCISQKFPIYSAWLLKNFEKVQTQIIFYLQNTVIPSISKDSFICDLFVRKNSIDQSFDIQILGIYPLLSTLSFGLFNWKDDSNQIKNGPLQMRIQKEKLFFFENYEEILVPLFWINFANNYINSILWWKKIRFFLVFIVLTLLFIKFFLMVYIIPFVAIKINSQYSIKMFPSNINKIINQINV